MQAAWYESQGPARAVLEVGTLPAPRPGPGEVRVRVAVSAVNPVDVKRRLGGRGAMDGPRVVPHFDGAGVIDAVGEGVAADRVGEHVWVYEAQWQRAAGTAAHWVVLPQRLAVPLPTAREPSLLPAGQAIAVGPLLAAGACLGIPALTAYQCVYDGGPVTGQLVLVTGGAGAVGNYAVQFARLGGAMVIATASSDEKAERARAAGADLVIDYRRQDVAAEIERYSGGAGVDRIVDVAFAANLETSLRVLKPGGTLATYASDIDPEPVLPFYRFMYRSLRVHFELVFLMPAALREQALADITRWLAEDVLVHPPVRLLPLSEIVAAHEAVEQGSDARLLLVPE
jgi:NADPH2:quinone reductase